MKKQRLIFHLGMIQGQLNSVATFSMDAFIIGFGLSSRNGSWLTNVALFLGRILLYRAAAVITTSALLPPWMRRVLPCKGTSPTCYPP